MRGHDLDRDVADNYRGFAEDARGRSPAYESLANAVTAAPAILTFLARLPAEKRQPNPLFAAARYLLGAGAAPPDIDALRALISQNRTELTQLMLTRRTHTNEPARCATLLPALAQLPPPLALIEVGASAGLTLLLECHTGASRPSNPRLDIPIYNRSGIGLIADARSVRRGPSRLVVTGEPRPGEPWLAGNAGGSTQSRGNRGPRLVVLRQVPARPILEREPD
jgi:hypothetical protein